MNLIRKYPSNWNKETCDFVMKLKPELQEFMILFCSKPLLTAKGYKLVYKLEKL